MKKILLALLFSLVALPAFAACTPGFIAAPGSGSNQTFSTKAAADTNCESLMDIDTSSQLHADLTAAVPAGTNTIGNVGSDPSAGKGTPSSAAINISTATTTQLVAASGSTSIYVTSFDVIAGGTGTFQLEYSTVANCASGVTILTGAYPLTAQTGIAKGDGAATVLKVPSGNGLCAVTNAAVQMSGAVSYQQF